MKQIIQLLAGVARTEFEQRSLKVSLVKQVEFLENPSLHTASSHKVNKVKNFNFPALTALALITNQSVGQPFIQSSNQSVS